MLDMIKGVTVTFNSGESITFSGKGFDLALERTAEVDVWKKFLKSKVSGIPTFPILSMAGNVRDGIPANRNIFSGEYFRFAKEVIGDLLERLNDEVDDEEKVTIEEFEYADKSFIRFKGKYILEYDAENFWKGSDKDGKIMNREKIVDKIRTNNDLVSILDKSEGEGLFLSK